MFRLFVPLLSALYLLGLFGMAGGSLDVTWIPGWTGIDAEAVAMPAQVQVETPERAARRCPHCGRIESKREILSGAGDSQDFPVYEYTLRKSDGSIGVFQESLPVRWRLGEQLIFIDGASPRASPVAAGSQQD